MKRLTLLLPLALLACAPAPQSATYASVSVQDLKLAADSGAYVLDVRTPQEFAEGHVAGAVNLPLNEVAARGAEVPSDKVVYVICRSGSRSAQASEILHELGKDVRNVSGGMNDWASAGYPLAR